MFAYRTPGVYFEWLDSRLHAIAGVRTDIAAFVGIAERGPLLTPVKVESPAQFQSIFGGPMPNAYLAYAVAGFFTNGGSGCWIVRVANPAAAKTGAAALPAGGATGLVVQADSPGTWSSGMNVSVLRNGADRFTLTLRLPDGSQESWRNLSMQGPSIDLLDPTGVPVLRVAVSDRTLWTEDVTVTLALTAPDAFTLNVEGPDGREETFKGLSTDPGSNSYAVQVLAGSTMVRARDLTDGKPPHPMPDPLAPNLRNGSALLTGDARFAGTMLGDGTLDGSLTGSKLAFVASIPDVTDFPDNTPDPTPGVLPQGGVDGLGSLAGDHFLAGLAALENVDEIGIVAMPDMMPKPHVVVPPKPRKRDCRLIEVFAPDPPVIPPEWPPEFDESQISALQQGLIQHCEALKYRVAVLEMPVANAAAAEVLDWRTQFDTRYAALYHPWVAAPDPLELDGLLRSIPPSGHVAGIYARCDLNRGVHKPPANEIVDGVMDLALAIDDLAHADLNDAGVNVIRSQAGRGIRVAGERTLSSDTPWRYVNVRRLLIFIEKSIDVSCQWTVFEPNNPDLWREIRRVAVSFLDDLFKRGMLDGSTAEQAYTVICDETTNPPEETDAGRMICKIGVQPPWPAEFVIVRIGKMEDRTLIVENPGGGNG